MAIPWGEALIQLLLVKLLGESIVVELATSVTPPGGPRNGRLFKIQASPEASMAMLSGSLKRPPVPVYSPMVKSLGWALSMGWNGAVPVCKPYKFAIFAPGAWAMLSAAVAVSVVVSDGFTAFVNNVVQAVELGPAELTHAARMLA